MSIIDLSGKPQFDSKQHICINLQIFPLNLKPVLDNQRKDQMMHFAPSHNFFLTLDDKHPLLKLIVWNVHWCRAHLQTQQHHALTLHRFQSWVFPKWKLYTKDPLLIGKRPLVLINIVGVKTLSQLFNFSNIISWMKLKPIRTIHNIKELVFYFNQKFLITSMTTQYFSKKEKNHATIFVRQFLYWKTNYFRRIWICINAYSLGTIWLKAK